MSQNLLSGANILNPFIRPRPFLLWCEDLIHQRNKTDLDDLDTGDQFLYKMQKNVLSASGILHVGVVGEIARALLNNLTRLNVFLASEWKHELFQAGNNQAKIDRGLGRTLLYNFFFLIPVLVMTSLGKRLYRSVLKFRSEIVFSVMLAITIVTFV